MVKNEELLKIGRGILAKERYGLDELPWYTTPTITIDEEHCLRLTSGWYTFKGYDFSKPSNGESTKEIYKTEIAKLEEDLKANPMLSIRLVNHAVEGNIGWFIERWCTKAEVSELVAREKK
jgi:hypothetical protein